jgi:hypothetical protein
VAVLSYKSIKDYETEIKTSTHIPVFGQESQWLVPMIFVEVESTDAGKSYEPKMFATINNDKATVKPWAMNQMMLNSKFHQSFIVNIQFWQPGVYTYQTEAVFKNRIGQYAPIPIGEPRTIMVRDPKEQAAFPDKEHADRAPIPDYNVRPVIPDVAPSAKKGK